MDGHRFDAWVAKLGTRTGRRPLILGAIAALAAKPGVARGQPTLVSPGGACTATGQCAQNHACGGFAPVTCASNGYAADGALNCCRGQAEFCGVHAECCDALMCLGSNTIDGCGAGRCLPRDVVGEIAAGTACTESAQCSQEGGSAVCSEEGLCCLFEGSRCAVGAQCCGALSCVKDDPTDPSFFSPGTCAFTG